MGGEGQPACQAPGAARARGARERRASLDRRSLTAGRDFDKVPAMMREENKILLKSLVCVAWADGHLAEKERELIDALISSFDADEAQAKEIRAYADEKKTLDDVPVEELSDDDCRVLLQHATLMTWADGEQHEDEKAMLGELARRCGLPEPEAHAIIEYANQRARKFLNLL